MVGEITRALNQVIQELGKVHARDDVQLVGLSIKLYRISDALHKYGELIKEENLIQRDQLQKQHVLNRLRAGIGIPPTSLLPD